MVPVFNEEHTIPELVARVAEVMDKIGKTYEFLIVDDGSQDDTRLRILEQARLFPRVKGIFLARNYGQSTALQAGFDLAAGDIVITLDGDLQNDPADIPMMLHTLQAEQADLVCGWRAERQDGQLRIFASKIANRMIGQFTGVKLHDYGCSLKVYRRKILDRTRLYGELHRFLPALVAEVGGRVAEVKVHHHPRTRGVSKYGLDRTARVVLDTILMVFLRKYLQRPLHFFGGMGLALNAVGLISLVYLVGIKFYFSAQIGHRPLLIFGVMCVLLGIMFIGLGLIGEIMGRIYFKGHAQYHLAEGPEDRLVTKD